MRYDATDGQFVSLITAVLIQCTVLLCVTFVVLGLTHKTSAANRHYVAMGVLLALPLLPVLFVLASHRVKPVSVHQASVIEVNLPRFNYGPASPLPLASNKPAEMAPIQGGSDAIQMPAGGVVANQTTQLATIRKGLPVCLWMVGVVVSMLKLLIGLLRLRRVARYQSKQVSETLRAEIERMLREMHFTRSVRILQGDPSARVFAPVVWGVRRPTLLLPNDVSSWPSGRLGVVLLHEMAHIDRGDWLTQIIRTVVCAMYWFHPLVWALNRFCQAEAERACDNVVIQAGVQQADYAEHLLGLVLSARSNKHTIGPMLSFARTTQIQYRMRSILDPRQIRSSSTATVRGAVGVVMGLTSVLSTQILTHSHAFEQSDRSRTNVNAVQGSGATLPDGTSVELVAVGSHPQGVGDDWWSPTGQPLMEIPEQQVTLYRPSGYEFPANKVLVRTLFVRMRTKQSRDISVTGCVVDRDKRLQTGLYHYGRGPRINSGVHSSKYSVSGILPVGLAAKETKCIYRIGVATGPWETVSSTRITLNPRPSRARSEYDLSNRSATLFLDNQPHVEYWDAAGHRQTLEITPNSISLGDVARKVVVIGPDGQEIPLELLRDEMTGGTQNVPAVTVATKVELRLQTRPYQWVEFKNIVLNHLVIRAANPIATPAALPTYVHKFKCGVTLTARAITERHVDGGRWWMPDGKLLAGPIKEYLTEANQNYWRHGTHPRLVALEFTSRNTVSFTEFSSFTGSLPDIRDEFDPGIDTRLIARQTCLSTDGREFSPGLKQTTLRFGIASGPWKTAAVVAFPTNLHASDRKVSPYANDITLANYVNPGPREVPQLQYTSLDGRAMKIPFQIVDRTYNSRVARRFVAVGKDGTITPLMNTCAAELKHDTSGMPIPKDPANIGATELMVSDYYHRSIIQARLDLGNNNMSSTMGRPLNLKNVREFRLEYRPYEWAEFREISLAPRR